MTQAEALYNLDALMLQFPGPVENFFYQVCYGLGNPNVPCVPDTLADSIIAGGSNNFAAALHPWVQDWSKGSYERTLIGFDGTQSQGQFQQWVENVVAAIKNINAAAASPAQQQSPAEKKILGLPQYWFFVLLMIVIIAALAFVLYIK